MYICVCTYVCRCDNYMIITDDFRASVRTYMYYPTYLYGIFADPPQKKRCAAPGGTLAGGPGGPRCHVARCHNQDQGHWRACFECGLPAPAPWLGVVRLCVVCVSVSASVCLRVCVSVFVALSEGEAVVAAVPPPPPPYT